MIFVFQALNKPIVNNTQACNEQKLENVKNCLKQWHSCLHVAIFWRKKKKKKKAASYNNVTVYVQTSIANNTFIYRK